jgi:hypothetical protein
VTLGELPSISSSGAPALLNRNLGSTRTALAAVRIWLDARSDLIIGRQLLRLLAPSLSSLRIREIACRETSNGGFASRDCLAQRQANMSDVKAMFVEMKGAIG